MLRFAFDRVVRLIAVLVAITIASFLFLHAVPGDPVQLRLGEHASPQEIAHLTRSLGLDKPWYVQLFAYFAALARGDLGNSIADTQPVAQKLLAYFPATL